MTKNQAIFLSAIKGLDDLQMGCLAVGAQQPAPVITEHLCIARGWIRSVPADNPWGRIMYLTTKGLKALNKSSHAI